ncbi:MAG: aldo/keto reductase [Verrucomicrobiae bacterium]|nr:aldo/keto reductase [Verrucomicrobiae bacterium]
MTTQFTRRDFLKVSAAGAAGAVLARLEAEAAAFQRPAGRMPTRVLGKTGVTVGIMALGGYSAVVDFPSDELAVKFIHDCMDSGINYLDTAPVYQHTDDPRSSERRFGKALVKRRKEVFLNTKSMKRDRDEAMRDIETSLKLLQTDYLDGFQIHCIDPKKDDLKSFGKPDGIYTLARKLKDQKVFRFIGITTHLSAALLKEALEMYEFDTVLATFNPTKERQGYEELVLPVAQKQNLGIIAMKIMGGATKYNQTTMDGLPAKLVGADKGKGPADKLLRYALSLPIHTATSGVASYAQLRQNLEVCYNFKPMEDSERRAMQIALHDSDVFLAYNKPGYAWA